MLKFEMGDPATFNRLTPSTTFDRRVEAIANVKKSGMLLVSGNIVDYPGQTLEQQAAKILLTASLGISWAPVIPYMSAPGTPLAEEGGPGSILLNLKEISILRILCPDIRITAQQPGYNLRDGLAGEEGNLLALEDRANILFCDLPNEAQSRAFQVVEREDLRGKAHLFDMAEKTGIPLSFD